MADQPQLLDTGTISAKSLGMAYRVIVQTLGHANLRATAAFVTAFAAPRAAVEECLPLLERLGELNPRWFAYILPLLRNCRPADGWEGHALWNQLAAAGHEMAWHGTTHMPLHDTTCAEAIDIELHIATALFASLGHVPKSIVFPRNQVGHLERLRKADFSTYRASAGVGGFKRATGLIREWNLLDSGGSEKPLFKDEWCVVPAGCFLNWPSGIRSTVPVSATIQRWRSMLRNAVESGGYVHMWFHPHNLITAPAMQESFTQLMREIGSLVRNGDLLNLTMGETAGYLGGD